MSGETMFDRYNIDALVVIFSARREATRLGAAAIDTEHLLLGVCRAAASVAWAVLNDLSISPDDLVKEIDGSAKWRVASQEADDLPLTTGAKRVLKYAEEEGDSTGSSHIGPADILVGLIREEDGYASVLMRQRDVSLDDVRKAIRAHRRPRQ